MPFGIELIKYFHELQAAQQWPSRGDDNPATAGAGLRLTPVEIRAGAGTDMSQKVDFAAAFIKLIDKQKKTPIGTFLVGQELVPQTVDVDGQPYEIALRFTRYYKPYLRSNCWRMSAG